MENISIVIFSSDSLLETENEAIKNNLKCDVFTLNIPLSLKLNLYWRSLQKVAHQEILVNNDQL